ncbi:uncharacterized protein A1O9_02134 [Exophiala aquamarina CBS 119918]|uniref:GABA permease n=1 Tax=Exophiala aquamarina CBS 119918 TaxID=1182545 RepID=A0A072PMJ7_9EURO|nr:uncharacterized protein A1O9_02134 [Exophiala aquamarina CBS 119918]KEF60573.1 hypothetical protein A1O9_02134 [Exophiala aquamarina CBS 119918]
MATKQLSAIVQGQKNEAFDASMGNEVQLAKLGYEQELKRSFSLIGMVGFSFSIVTSWTALGGTLIVGIVAGGSAVMVWSWLGISVLSLCVAYSFAEMCSAYPIAGGQYSWIFISNSETTVVAILTPPKYARGAAWVTGWFMCTGAVAMGATTNFIAASFLLGMANLNNPSYTIERWHCVQVTYLLAMFTALINVFYSRFLNHIYTFALVFNVLSFFVVTFTILVCKDNKQPASFIFSDFQNETGFESPGMGIMIGLLQSFFGDHMTEEMLNPAKEAPKAIVLSVYLGAVTGFAFLVAAFSCVGDLETTALTSTGVPLIQIFYDSTNSVSVATGLAAMITVILIIAANSLMAEGSRALWAFARDHGLPFSSVFAKVNKRSHVPVYSIILCQMGLNSLYFAFYTGLATVISIATFGFYLSYAMPLLMRLLMRLWSYFNGSNPQSRQMPGAYTLGRWSPFMNAIGLAFLVFAGVDFNFPQVGPVNAENMDYCSAAFGVIGLISVVTWIFDGKKSFTGPQTEFLACIKLEERLKARGAVGFSKM